MVDAPSTILLAAKSSAASELPPPVRIAAMMALLGIALLGLLLIVSTLLGGHWVRRLGRHKRGPAVPPDVLPPKPNTIQPEGEHSPSTNTKPNNNPSNGDTTRTEDTMHS